MDNIVKERSFEILTIDDLQRVKELVIEDLKGLYERRSLTGRLYADRLIALCLCQGAAEHFVRPGRGVKDFDVWAFFSKHPVRAFPYRRRGTADFGLSRLGRHPDDTGFAGRRVDVIGRSLQVRDSQTGMEAVREWLCSGRTKSARLISLRPVVILAPERFLGQVLWDPTTNSTT